MVENLGILTKVWSRRDAVTRRKSKLLKSGLVSASILWVRGEGEDGEEGGWVAKELQAGSMGRGQPWRRGNLWVGGGPHGWSGRVRWTARSKLSQPQAYWGGGRAAPPLGGRFPAPLGSGGKTALVSLFSWPQPPAASRPCPSSSGPWCWAPPLRPGSRALASPREAAHCLPPPGPPRTGRGERASAVGCGARRLPAICPNPTLAPLRLPPPRVFSALRIRSAAAWKLVTSICVRLVAVSQLLSRRWMGKCGKCQRQFLWRRRRKLFSRGLWVIWSCLT